MVADSLMQPIEWIWLNKATTEKKIKMMLLAEGPKTRDGFHGWEGDSKRFGKDPGQKGGPLVGLQSIENPGDIREAVG